MNKEKLWQRSKQRIRFRNDDMDFYFAWILAHQNEGGSALGECFYTASQIKDGDPESWYKAWSEMARRVESQASTGTGKRGTGLVRVKPTCAPSHIIRWQASLFAREIHDYVRYGKRHNGASDKQLLNVSHLPNPLRSRSKVNFYQGIFCGVTTRAGKHQR
jgi:hypothetical protein